jgi:3-hydroxyisobutyrate dehydrogenase
MLDISPQQTRIGWIGTGVMGGSMCRHLLQAGYPITVFNRTPGKATPLIEAGAVWGSSPLEVARQSDVVFTIVGMPEDVREVILGEQGVLAGSKEGNVIVDMTTSSPQLAVEIFQRAAARKVFALDAPVSGGDIGARNGTLSIMIGGQREIVDSLKPIWEKIGQQFVHQGEAGTGQHTKMVNQILIAAGMIGICESLLYAHRAGLNLNSVLASVSQGAAGSWGLSNLAPRIVQNNFAPGFYIDHFVKDLSIAIEESDKMRLKLPGLKLARQLYTDLQQQGLGSCGTQALQLSLARLSGIDWQSR